MPIKHVYIVVVVISLWFASLDVNRDVSILYCWSSSSDRVDWMCNTLIAVVFLVLAD